MTSLEIGKWDALFRIPQVDSPLSMVSSNVYSFPSSEQFPDGGTEWLIELSRDPRITAFAVPIQTQNLKILYQTPLTPKEIAEGSSRPRNIEGSLAVYSNHLRNNEYKCGKIFHLPVPHFMDSDGAEAWGTYNPDVHEIGQLVISLPTDFLKTAKYPVVVDPTFGKTDIGGSNLNWRGHGHNYVTVFTCPAAGTATSLHAYVREQGGDSDVEIKLSLYDLSGGHPDDRLAVTAGISATAWPAHPLWYNSAISQAVAASTDYALSVTATTGGSSNNWELQYDAGTTDQTHYRTDDYEDPDDPFGTCDGHEDWEISIYATYTAAGGISIPVVMHNRRMQTNR